MAKKKQGKKHGEGGSKRIFRSFRDKDKATTTPVASVDDFKGLWDREFGVYRPTVVKVNDRKGSKIFFDLVIDPDGTTDKGNHTVDLDDGASVWGDLPSTAQLVDPDSKEVFGYLLLNQNWLYENVGDDLSRALSDPGDPPKFPRYMSL